MVQLGCRTTPLPPVDLAAPGWQTHPAQAVWRPNRHAPELVGELLYATRTNGESLVQFSKNPFPLVTAQTTRHAWRIEFAAVGKKYSAPGIPPARLLWFQLAPLAHTNHLRLENNSTGEALEVFANP
ncbi:MAG: hypothetical protein RL380_626 [Verrucomicrobiota bacterium]